MRSVLVFLMLMLLSSCTVYTEKQSEALSRTVYLAEDSFELGRFDITDSALTNAVRIVKPPKKKIEVKAIEKTVASISPQSSVQKVDRKVIVPEKFKNQQIIVVNTEEYQQLLKDKKLFEQLQSDNKALDKLKTEVDEELSRQLAYSNKMIEDLNKMQKELLSKRLHILKLYIVIAFLVFSIIGGVYLRIKGVL